MLDVGPPFGGSEEAGGGSRLVVVFVLVEIDVVILEDEDGEPAAVEVTARQEPDMTPTAFCTREGEHEFCMQYLAEEENVLQRQPPVFWVRWLILHQSSGVSLQLKSSIVQEHVIKADAVHAC